MNDKKSFVIGLDGGGTKTAAELCDLGGNVRSEAQGGPSNFQVIGAEKSVGTILDLIETCCHSVGCRGSDIAAVVAGLTGAGRPNDQLRMEQALKEAAAKKHLNIGLVIVESDARIALEGALGGNPGMIVIAGTGSIVFGKDEHGVVHRAGGWGRILGDEGSGQWMGKEAFRAVARTLDERGRKTSLTGLFAKQLNLDSQITIIDALYRRDFDMASVMPVVLEAAKDGDAVAKAILNDAATELVDVIKATAAKVKSQKSKRTRLALIGSLIDHDNVYSKIVRTLIRKRLPWIQIVQPESSPVHGAVLMAIAAVNQGYKR